MLVHPASHTIRRGMLHDVDPPAAAAADGQPLPRLERARLDGADRGWAVDGRTTILKARAREFRIE